jgi:hypothetical protein
VLNIDGALFLAAFMGKYRFPGAVDNAPASTEKGETPVNVSCIIAGTSEVAAQ